MKFYRFRVVYSLLVHNTVVHTEVIARSQSYATRRKMIDYETSTS